MRDLNERMMFSGGAEETPTIQVVRFRCPGSMNDGNRSLFIEQAGESVMISPETMQAILDWYNR